MTSGTDISEYGKLVTKTMLEVRAGGQGKPGHKNRYFSRKSCSFMMKIYMDLESREKIF